MRVILALLCALALPVGLQAQDAVPPSVSAPAPAPQPIPKAPFVSDIKPQGRTPSNLEVDEVMLAAMPVAIVRLEGTIEDAPTVIPAKIDELTTKLGQAGLSASGASMAYYLSVDEGSFSADLMVPLDELPKTALDGVRFETTPAGKALRIVHRGPLDTLEDTYLELETFVEDRNLTVQETSLERYINNPGVTAGKDMLIEVYVLLKAEVKPAEPATPEPPPQPAPVP